MAGGLASSRRILRAVEVGRGEELRPRPHLGVAMLTWVEISFDDRAQDRVVQGPPLETVQDDAQRRRRRGPRAADTTRSRGRQRSVSTDLSSGVAVVTDAGRHRWRIAACLERRSPGAVGRCLNPATLCSELEPYAVPAPGQAKAGPDGAMVARVYSHGTPTVEPPLRTMPVQDRLPADVGPTAGGTSSRGSEPVRKLRAVGATVGATGPEPPSPSPMHRESCRPARRAPVVHASYGRCHHDGATGHRRGGSRRRREVAAGTAPCQHGRPLQRAS